MSENTVKHEHKQCGGKNIEKMEEIGKTMPVEEEIYDVAELFKVLGDQTRVKILFTLIKDEMIISQRNPAALAVGNVTVCYLASAQSA